MRRIIIVAAVVLTGIMLSLPAHAQIGTQTPTAIVTTLPGLPGSWRGYILIAVQPENQALLDSKTMQAVLERFAETRGDWPPYILQIGPFNLTKTQLMVEAKWSPTPTKDMIAQILAVRTGISPEIINAGIEVTIFAPAGTWEESREQAFAYIQAHRNEWVPADVAQ